MLLTGRLRTHKVRRVSPSISTCEIRENRAKRTEKTNDRIVADGLAFQAMGHVSL
jgi:hypothetical protein